MNFVSVIVPTYNRPLDIQNLLESIVIQTLLPNEVIIVDQSENELTRAIVKDFSRVEKARGINFIWHYQKEKGLTRARNKGFGLSRGDIICYMDDDLVLDKDYLKEIIRQFEIDPHVGGVSGNVQLANPARGFRWSLRKLLLRFFLIDFFNGKMTPSGFGYPIYLNEINQLTGVQLFPGYSMNFRRECFKENLFDEFFTGYCFREDVEFSYRISQTAKMVMVPSARFVHNVSQTGRTEFKELKKMQFRNYHYVFNKLKNHSPLNSILFAYSVAGILFIDLIEWLCTFDAVKWKIFVADASTVALLMAGKL